jgi:type 2 lantibiotic biosynthesis protein LanM
MVRNFTSFELRDLAARASTIEERLDGDFVPVDDEASAAKADRHLRTWCDLATAGDDVSFRRRLIADGIDVDAIQPLLGDVRLADQSEMPSWIYTFRWAFEAMASADLGGSPRRFIYSEEQLPFEEVLVPLVERARDRRDMSLGSDRAALTERAHAGLQRALMKRLSDLCGPALCEGFALFVMTEQSSALLTGLATSGDPGSRVQYERYLAELRREDLRTCFIRRPVLARLLARITELWMAATAELIQRLRADLPVLADAFHGGRDLGPVTEIGLGLSEPHNGGRTVCRLAFENGPTIGYKPTDLGLDGAWHNFLNWLDGRGAPPSAKAPHVVERPGYGWVEWISHEPCAGTQEAKGFFQRAGAMLCLFRLLQGTDFHSENIIAEGERPVPVDLETLMSPRLSTSTVGGGTHRATIVAAERLHGSALATLYLPFWVPQPGGRAVAIGGLDRWDLQNVQRWGARDINTDAMSYGLVDPPNKRRSNLPTLAGEPLSGEEHRNEIARGYEKMYRFLLRQRCALLADDSPLIAFRGKLARSVLRSTQLYALLVHRSLSGHHLGDGVTWSLQFEFLNRFVNFEEETDHTWAQQRAERCSLQDLDIPYATMRSDRRDLELCGGTVIEDFVERSSFDRLIDKVEGLSETDLHQELEIIAQSLETPVFAGVPRVEPWPSASSDLSDGVNLTAEVAIAQAQKLGTTLDKEAIREDDGAVWIGAVPLPLEERTQLGVIGHDLYAGAGGVALFLGALHRVTGEGHYRELAMSALAPLRAALADTDNIARTARLMGIGGAAGVGSVIYALAKSSVLLDHPLLLVDALRTAKAISNELIESDRQLDVIGGSAGAVLALLALRKLRPEDWILDRAVACGRHLVRRQRPCTEGGRAWQGPTFRQPLTGFSHGAAGIVMALLRLYRETREPDFLNAARDGIAYETATYSSAERSWPDLREISGRPAGVNHVCQWCNGSAGIGLARIDGLDILDDDAILADIEVSLHATSKAPIGAVDHLCCGNFGRLEVLFSAGRYLGREDLVSLARRRASHLIARAEDSGNFGWAVGTDRNNPGFFTGVSGVGYTLLRFTHPEILSSVLLWD